MSAIIPGGGRSGGRGGYLLVGQRGVLSEQLREVRDSSSSGGVDPFLLYRIQLIKREVGGAQMCTQKRNPPRRAHPALASPDSAEAANA